MPANVPGDAIERALMQRFQQIGKIEQAIQLACPIL